MLKIRLLILLASLTVSMDLAVNGFAQSPGQPQGPSRGVAPVQTALTSSFRATNYAAVAHSTIRGCSSERKRGSVK